MQRLILNGRLSAAIKFWDIWMSGHCVYYRCRGNYRGPHSAYRATYVLKVKKYCVKRRVTKNATPTFINGVSRATAYLFRHVDALSRTSSLLPSPLFLDAQRLYPRVFLGSPALAALPGMAATLFCRRNPGYPALAVFVRG